MRGGTVTVSWVWMVLRAADSYGVPAESILDSATFDLGALKDPEGRIPMRQYLDLLDTAARLTGAPELGLRSGTFVRPDLHITSLLVLNAPTLGDVYDRMCRMSRFHWDRSNIRLEVDGAQARIVTEPPRVAPELGFRHFLDSRLSIWLNFGRIAVGERWTAQSVTTMLDPAAPAQECVEFFGCPVTGGGSRLEMVFDRALLDRPTVKHFPPLDQAMQDLSVDMLASLSRPGGFAEETRRAILARLPERRGLTAAEMARAADLSVRTFERRLQKEGTTFVRLLEETRIRMACHYFSVGDLPLSSIAFLVGYNSQAAFDHAFRRVMNNTPSAVRKAMLAEREIRLPSPSDATPTPTPTPTPN